jgi:hypothetical protein
MEAIRGSGIRGEDQGAKQELRLRRLDLFIFLCVFIHLFAVLGGQRKIQRTTCPPKEDALSERPWSSRFQDCRSEVQVRKQDQEISVEAPGCTRLSPHDWTAREVPLAFSSERCCCEKDIA